MHSKRVKLEVPLISYFFLSSSEDELIGEIVFQNRALHIFILEQLLGLDKRVAAYFLRPSMLIDRWLNACILFDLELIAQSSP